VRYSHQENILNQNPKYQGLFWEMRLGKTRSAIELAEKNGSSCLVITPKSLVINFENEIKKWGVKQTIWKVISKETFRRDWDKLEKYDGIIADEAHHLAGHTSQLHKNFIKYCKKNKPKFIYLLTGTPFRSSPYNAYAMAKMLGHNLNWRDFTHKCFDMVRMGSRMIPVERKEAKKVVENIFHKIGQFVKMSDVIDDLPSKIVTNEYFELTKEQKKGIEDIIAIEPIVRFTAESQIVGGSLKGNEYTPPQYYKSEKLERAVEIAKENKKSIIVCHYNMELDLLAKLIPNSYVLNGDVSAIDKDRIIKEANIKDCCLLIQAQCSEGYSLSSFDLMVFYSLSWSVVDYLQMQSRIIAAEKKRPVEYIHFVCKNSIDEKIYKNIIIEKKDFITKLYET